MPAVGQTWWQPVVIVGAGCVAYSNSFRGAFVFDDLVHIGASDSIKHLWPITDVLSGSQRPLVNLTLAVNYAISGLDTWSYHLFNLFVHLLAALILYGVLRRTAWRRGKGEEGGAVNGQAAAFATIVALLWVVHPLTTQSVTYIVQRGESMMGLFYLLTLYCAIRGDDSAHSTRWYAGAVAACACGAVTKAVIVTSPLIVAIYDWMFLGRTWRTCLRRRWGLYVLLVATWGLFWASGVAQSVLSSGVGRNTSVGFRFKGITPLAYLLTQPGVIVQYLKLSVWPVSLCLDYAWPVARGLREIIVPGLLVGALLVGSIWATLKKSWVGFVGAWFFLILSPTSTVIPIRDPLVEHRMYLPLISVIVLVVGGANALLDRWLGATPHMSVRRRLAGTTVTAIAAATLMTLTIRRNHDYRSEAAMWRDVVQKRPNNARAHMNLGGLLADPAKALQAFQRAIDLRPDYAEAHYNLGRTLAAMGRTEEAITAYRQAIQQDPHLASAHYNLGNALVRLGRTDEAIECFRAATHADPAHAKAWCNWGVQLAKRRQYRDAIVPFRRAVAADPGFLEAWLYLARCLRAVSDWDEAVTAYRNVLRIDPDHQAAQSELNATLLEMRGEGRP